MTGAASADTASGVGSLGGVDGCGFGTCRACALRRDQRRKKPGSPSLSRNLAASSEPALGLFFWIMAFFKPIRVFPFRLFLLGHIIFKHKLLYPAINFGRHRHRKYLGTDFAISGRFEVFHGGEKRGNFFALIAVTDHVHAWTLAHEVEIIAVRCGAQQL